MSAKFPFVLVVLALASCNAKVPAQEKQEAAPASLAEAGAGAPAATTPADDSDDIAWPRTINQGGANIVIYQPQIEKWDQDKLAGRTAVAVTPAGGAKESFGVIEFTARTEVDKDNHIVTFEDVQITSASFPGNKNSEPEYLAMIRQGGSEVVRVVSLEQFEANVAASKAMAAPQQLDVKNNPPDILFSTKPSILILIDGDPVLRQVTGAKALRVVNTRSLILLDESSGQYYLFLMNHWVSGKSATGPWTAASSVPAGFDGIKDELAKADTVDLLEPKNPEGAPKDLPVIYVSTRPAELIQSRGDPQYSPVTGTTLLYMENTESAVFMQMGTGESYVLVSGRWFSSKSLEGPWAYVKDLPPDFSKIPADSPKANVLCSVPNTSQAKEAVIANSIPQTAKVTIADTHLTVTYDGTPKFKRIDDAKGLEYAVNSPQPVVLVKESKTYYCANNGVWFLAAAPTGPWIVATSVPGVIYTIPPSSPVHYVTYVRIYGSTPTVVYVGYTPGYMGTCVSPSGVVVYGTGYYYPAYVGTVWVGYPPTYGYGAGFAYGSATGFAFGFAAGAMIGSCWSHPYWGPCYGYGSVNINSHSCYTNYRGGVTSTNRHYSYDASTGKSTATGRGSSFNPYTGRASAGGYSSYINRDSGNFNMKGAGATYNPKTGTVSARGAQATGNMYNGDLNVKSGSAKYNTKTNTGVGHYGNDVYASHDGNVYKHSADDGWQKNTGSGWQDASRSGGNSWSQDRDNLDSQRSSRDTGEQRFNESRGSGGFHGFGGGGGGFGGGGGGWGGFHGGFRGRR